MGIETERLSLWTPEQKEIKFHLPTLIIVSHADDEAFAMGGAMSMFRKSGAYVGIITLTDSANGNGHSGVRRQEQDEVARYIGAEVFHVGHEYGIPDGKLNDPEYMYLAAIGIRSVFNEFSQRGQPIARVLGFGEDGLTGHDDHKAAHRLMHDVLNQDLINPDLQEMWEIGFTPRERDGFLESHNGEYFTDVPLLDRTDDLTAIRLSPRSLWDKRYMLSLYETQREDTSKRINTLPLHEHYRIMLINNAFVDISDLNSA